MKILLISLLFLLGPGLGSAVAGQMGQIEGESDAAFAGALELWLSDDDEHSLARLAELARDGNRAARLLLARIEFTDRAPSAFVLGLDRKQRDALYRGRREGSRFNPSWIRIEAENGDAFAQTLRQAGALGISFETIRRLYALGEPQAAEHQIRKVAVDGSPEERERLAEFLGPDDELAPYLHGFRFALDGETTGYAALQTIVGQLEELPFNEVTLVDNADSRRAMLFVDIGYQAGRQVADYDLQGGYTEGLVQWLSSAPIARPIARLCDETCTLDDRSICLLTAFGLVGGFYELLRFDSPLERLITQQRFLSSPRATGMVARRIAAARSEAAVPVFAPGELMRRSACLAAALESRE